MNIFGSSSGASGGEGGEGSGGTYSGSGSSSSGGLDDAEECVASVLTPDDHEGESIINSTAYMDVMCNLLCMERVTNNSMYQVLLTTVLHGACVCVCVLFMLVFSLVITYYASLTMLISEQSKHT